jgi:hypothetical protein
LNCQRWSMLVFNYWQIWGQNLIGLFKKGKSQSLRKG